MIATLIYTNGCGIEPKIFTHEVREVIKKVTENGQNLGQIMDVWEMLENLWVELKENSNHRPMEVGDLIKLDNRLFLCCKEGFIEVD